MYTIRYHTITCNLFLMCTRILLRDGVSRQAVSDRIRHEIDVDLEESVSLLRSKAAALLKLNAEEIGQPH